MIEQCDLLGVPRPHATAEQACRFERPFTSRHGDRSSSAGRIDCYRRSAFVLDSKKLSAGTRASGGAALGAAPGLHAAAAAPRCFDAALLRARSHGFSAALAQDVPRFNGKRFKGVAADGYALRLTPAHLPRSTACCRLHRPTGARSSRPYPAPGSSVRCTPTSAMR